MQRLLGSGLVVPVFGVPHRVHNETATFSKPLESMGRYQGDLDMFKMAEIIIGHPKEQKDRITLIRAKARQASRTLLRLIVADSVGLQELIRGDTTEDIQDVGDGMVEIISQYDQPLQMNTRGEFGNYWTKQAVSTHLQALLSINSAVERNPLNVPIAEAKSVLANGAVILPIQAKRLS